MVWGRIGVVLATLVATAGLPVQNTQCAGTSRSIPIAVLPLNHQASVYNAAKAARVIHTQLTAVICENPRVLLLAEAAAERRDRGQARILIVGDLFWHQDQSAVFLRSVNAQTGVVFYSARQPIITDRPGLTILARRYVDSTVARFAGQ